MFIGIQPDLVGDESFSNQWITCFQAKGIDVKILNLLAGNPNLLEQVQCCDGVMWRWIHQPKLKAIAPRILSAIEYGCHIPTYPNSTTCWHYDEKLSQFYLLQSLHAPMPLTWVFWDHQQALEWAFDATYPVVCKLSVGAGSSNVYKLHHIDAARQMINRLFKRGFFPQTINGYQTKWPSNRAEWRFLARRLVDASRYILQTDYPQLDPGNWRAEYGYAYFQEFLPDNSFDTRIVVIGDRIFGHRRNNRPHDFRASGSGNLEFDPRLIDLRCVELAFELSEKAGFQSMAYDFLLQDNQPVITEISYTFPAWMIRSCPGHWDRRLNWIEGTLSPEAAIADAFLTEIQLKQNLKIP